MKSSLKKNVVLSILALALAFLPNINISNEQKFTQITPKESSSHILPFIHIVGGVSGNWSSAEAEDWCYVKNGVYIIENVTINAGNSPTGSGILITDSKNDYFIIRNCTIENAGTGSYDAGIKLENTCNGTIFNNTCSNNGRDGILLDNNCNNNTILENILFNNTQHGIRLNKLCYYNKITGNTVYENNYGIQITDNCHNNNITGNTLNSNEFYGLWLEYCDNNNITGNIANFNTRYGIYLYWSEWNNITGNTINDNALIGIYLDYFTINNLIRNNTINRNDLGIRLEQSDFNNVSENVLKDNNYCIYEVSCVGNLITDNDCTIPIVQTSISIDGTATGVGAHNWSWAFNQGLCTGSGTDLDPYIIENFKISGFGVENGIDIQNSNVSFFIQGCIIYNSLTAIYLENVNNSRLIKNNCSGNKDGIYLIYGCFNNVIFGNIANDNYQNGIYLEENCNYTLISCNTANNNNPAGILLKYSGYNNITGNIAIGNKYDGIFFDQGCDYNTITGNTVNSNFYGIEIVIGKFNNITGNTANYNEFYGIVIETGIKSIIMGNTANNNSDYGIYIKENSNNNTISGNNVNGNNDEGIYISNYCINNSISGNIVNDNYRGITIDFHSEFNIISGNTVNYNEEGIFLTLYCHNNTISENNIKSIAKGISLGDGCQDNTISGNNVKNCEDKGISFSEGCDSNEFTDNIIYNNSMGIDLSDCSDNSFYGNFFVNNTKHVNDEGTNNVWNSTTIGNYWDNYTEVHPNLAIDVDDNGIGDVPYNISLTPLIQDYLPIFDDEAPTILIDSPSSGTTFGYMAPSFNVRITDDYLYEMWYSLDGGLHIFIFTENDTINQSAWDAITDGNVTLTFYASDKPKKIGTAEVMIIKDYKAPTISINSPSSGDVFSNTAPSFNVRITDHYLNTMWYTIDGGLHNYTFTTNSTINQTVWNTMLDGAYTLTFYANDDLGHIGSAGVNFIKDTVAPVITINSPIEGEKFGKNAPSFTITIIEENLDTSWYSFDGGLINYTITDNRVFNQDAWAALTKGEITITFYAIDLAGNEATESVTVIKSIPSDGMGPGIIAIIVVSSVVGGIVLVAVVYILLKKRGVI